MALRDLGTLLDKENLVADRYLQQKNRLGSLAQEMIRDYLLLDSITHLATPWKNRSTFLNYFYQKKDSLIFSSWLGHFINQPLENYSHQFRLGKPLLILDKGKQLFPFLFKTLKEEQQARRYHRLPHLIQKIARLKNREAFQFLISCCQGRFWDFGENPLEIKTVERIIYGLRFYPEASAFHAIQALIKQMHPDSSDMINPQDLSISLSHICNHYIAPQGQNAQWLLRQYATLVSKYPDWEQLIRAGFESSFPYEIAYFEEKVDYYGRMLIESNNKFWIKTNCLRKLKQEKNPKRLLYLAAQNYQNLRAKNKFWAQDQDYQQELRSLLDQEIWVKNSVGDWVVETGSDQKPAFQLLLYFYQHYLEYAWDENQVKFIHQKGRDPNLQIPYEDKLQALLLGKSNQPANLYKELAENASPELLKALPPYYNNIIRFSSDNRLPAYPFLCLRQLVELRSYWDQNGHRVYLSSENRALLNQLGAKIPLPQRYKIENLLIEQLKLEELNILEWEGLLNQNRDKWYYQESLGRIIRKVYKKCALQLQEDSKAKQLFLKKLALFQKIPLGGLVSEYLSLAKLIFKPKESLLPDSVSQSSDSDIRFAQALVQEDPLLGVFSYYDNYLENPGNTEVPTQIELHHPKDYRVLATRIRGLKDLKAIRALFEFMESQLNPEQIPALISLLDDERVIEEKYFGQKVLGLKVSDYSVFLLEKINRHSFADEKDFYRKRPVHRFLFRDTRKSWRAKWQKDSLNYQNWEKEFFKLKIVKLSRQSSLNVNLLNNILHSTYYRREIHQVSILNNIYKVFPLSDRAFLDWPWQAKPEDLAKLQGQVWDAASARALIKGMEIPDDSTFCTSLLDWLGQVSHAWNREAQGHTFYELFSKSDLRYIPGRYFPPAYKTRIKNAIFLYIKRFPSNSWEETLGRRIIFFIENAGQSMKNQIRIARSSPEKAMRSEFLEDIYMHSVYKSLEDLLRNINGFLLAPNPEKTSSEINRFLEEDWGIFIPDRKMNPFQKILSDFKNTNPFEFYKKQLAPYQLDIFTIRGDLDDDKILDFLIWEPVTAFASISPGKRLIPFYSLIRLLEVANHTRLGFPPPLQHQHSVLFKLDFQLRIRAWIDYLTRKTKKPSGKGAHSTIRTK